MKVKREDPVNLSVCETCAERGRPNEPVYRLGVCRFCYLGLPHPKATSEQLTRERMGAYSRQRLGLLPARETHPRLMLTLASGRIKKGNTNIVDVLVSRNGRAGMTHAPTSCGLVFLIALGRNQVQQGRTAERDGRRHPAGRLRSCPRAGQNQVPSSGRSRNGRWLGRKACRRYTSR